MTAPYHHRDIGLYIAKSTTTTQGNLTGAWRYMRPVLDEKTAPCSAVCPAGEDIARIEMLAARGATEQAWQTIFMENPFPAVCGRVCFHTCESACNRGALDAPVAVYCLERFIGDAALSLNFIPDLPVQPENGKHIAIAGAGPAGLSAACFLNRLGYTCDVYEAAPEPGGILRWGIPRYRLPEPVLRKEIGRIMTSGVRLLCKTSFTRELLNTAKNRYDAVFIGCGYGNPVKTGIPGEELAKDGLAFLAACRGETPPAISGTAAVIGGGNTAVDTARSIIRAGGQPVIVYRRRREDMPAFSHEVEMALEEGALLMELAAPVHIAPENGKYRLTLQRMKPQIPKDGTRARVVPDEGLKETLEADHIFMAIGANPAETWMTPPDQSPHCITFHHATLIHESRYGLPVVFGGDLASPVKSVTDAIASGKQGAIILDILFRHGQEEIDDRLEGCTVGSGPALSLEMYLYGQRGNRKPDIVTFQELNTDYFQDLPKRAPARLPAKDRAASFEEVEDTFSERDAAAELRRCFNCGICNGCDNCRLFCPEMAVMAGDNHSGRRINLDYCKGCGICAAECPRCALSLLEETS